MNKSVVYMDRYRGVGGATNTFVVYGTIEQNTWHIEPEGYAETPEVLVCRLTIRNDDLLAAGTLETKTLNFTIVKTERSILPNVIAAAFGVVQPKAKYLPGFMDAEVHILASPSNWGTIREIVRHCSATLNKKNEH